MTYRGRAKKRKKGEPIHDQVVKRDKRSLANVQFSWPKNSGQIRSSEVMVRQIDIGSKAIARKVTKVISKKRKKKEMR